MPGATVRKLIETVCELFNQPRQRYALWQSPQWHSVWSAIDALELAQSAIDAYSDALSDAGNGETYLRLQGLAQCFSIQQNSCAAILQYLDIPNDNTEIYSQLRKMRNEFTHPIQTRDGYSHTFPPILLSHDRVTITSFRDEDLKTNIYKIPDLIDSHQSAITAILRDVISFINKNEQDHRAKFADDHLADIFRGISYQCRKIASASTEEGRSRDWDHAPYYIKTIQEKMDAFRSALSERRLPADEYFLGDPFSKLEYPLAQIRCFFLEECTEEAPDPRAVYIFAEYIRTQFNELEKVAREIDWEYNSPVLGPDLD